MRALVTGGCGFIGSNLARALVLEGHDVTVTDNLSTGSKENLPHGVHFCEIPSEKLYERLPRTDETKLDVAFHTAIPSSSPMYRSDRRKVTEAIDGFVNVMELARETGAKVVYASSSSVYGNLPTPWPENAILPHAFDWYTTARVAIEDLAKLYWKHYGTPSIGLRLFSVYGPGEESKGQYANLITQALWVARDGREFEIYGDGSQSRDFVHVSDVVDAFMLAVSSDVQCDVFNVGTGKAHSLNEALNVMSEMGIEVRRKYVRNPLPRYIYHTLADTAKAKEALGFEAKRSLREGIESFMKEVFV